MKRGLLPLIGIFLPGLSLTLLAVLMFGATQPKPLNPFEDYAAFMPGQPLPDLRSCDVWDSYPREALYAWCPSPGGAWKQIGLRGNWSTVEGAYFYPADTMRAGELLDWLGEADRITGRRGQWVIRWAHCTAFSRGNVRYQSKVFLISFR